MASDIPGIRPDKAQLICKNCGHEFEPKGNPCNVAPNASVPLDCPDCSVAGSVQHNRYSYISGVIGAVKVSEKE